MTPQYQEHWLSAYLDDELSAQERALVESRLQQDPAARELLEDLRRVRGLVATLPQWSSDFQFDASGLEIEPLDPASSLASPSADGLVNNSTKLPQPKPFLPGNGLASGDGTSAWRALLALAAGLVLAAIGGLYWSQQGGPTQAISMRSTVGSDAPADQPTAAAASRKRSEFMPPQLADGLTQADEALGDAGLGDAGLGDAGAFHIPKQAMVPEQAEVSEQARFSGQAMVQGLAMPEAMSEAMSETQPEAMSMAMSETQPEAMFKAQPEVSAALSPLAVAPVPSGSAAATPGVPGDLAGSSAGVELGQELAMAQAAPLAAGRFYCAHSDAWAEGEVRRALPEVAIFMPASIQPSLAQLVAGEPVAQRSMMRRAEQNGAGNREALAQQPQENSAAESSPIIACVVDDVSAGAWFARVQAFRALTPVSLPGVGGQANGRFSGPADQPSAPASIVLFLTQAEAEEILASVQAPEREPSLSYWRLIPAAKPARPEGAPTDKVILILSEPPK